jgi:hypothetical protein
MSGRLAPFALRPAFPRSSLTCASHIFCGAFFQHRLNFPDQPNITVYTMDGSFVQAGKCAQEYAERCGLPFEAGFFNLGRREGLKLVYLARAARLRARDRLARPGRPKAAGGPLTS